MAGRGMATSSVGAAPKSSANAFDGDGFGVQTGFKAMTGGFGEQQTTTAPSKRSAFGFGGAKEGKPQTSDHGFGSVSSGFGGGASSGNSTDNRGFGGMQFSTKWQEQSSKTTTYVSGGGSVAWPDYENLPPVIKASYIPHPDVADASSSMIAEIRKTNNETACKQMSMADGEHVDDICPVTKFEHCWGKYPEMLDSVLRQGFTSPSPIQCQMWPVLLSGHDCIGIAQTGSGKTLGFLLPAFVHIDMQPLPRSERKGPTVLVLTPTHELAQQIETECNKYSYKNMKTVCVYGGSPVNEQVEMMRQPGIDIVIATPGRFTDLVHRGAIKLDSFSYLVLDEADRMLDNGFLPQITQIRGYINPKRQTVMTSATWPASVRDLGCRLTVDPFLIVVGTLDLEACKNVEQIVIPVERVDRKAKFKDIVDMMGKNDKALVFVNGRGIADDVATQLGLAGVNAEALHGGRAQSSREQVMEDFRSGAVQVLVATDVASRGLDVPDCNIVVNYDMPRQMEEYVHRVGRTGSSFGASGVPGTQPGGPKHVPTNDELFDESNFFKSQKKEASWRPA